MTSIRWKAVRLSFFSFAVIGFLYSSLAAAVSDNRQFAGQGVAAFSDSLILALGLAAPSSVAVDSVEGQFGSLVRHQLAARLTERGLIAFIDRQAGAGKLLLQSFVNDANLDYRSIDAGLFRQGRVLRVFTMAGFGRTLDSGGVLSRSVDVFSVSVADTLSLDEARAARVPGHWLSPGMPASLFQRLVEPGIVVSVTGALVYIFFASR